MTTLLILNTSSERPIRKTVSNNHTEIWNWRQHFCWKLRRNDEINRVDHRVELYEEQQCSHQHDTRAHTFPKHDNANQTCLKWNKCKTPTCPHWRCPDDTAKDNKDNHSLCRLIFRMEHNRYCDTIGEVYGNSKSADLPLNVDNNWQ